MKSPAVKVIGGGSAFWEFGEDDAELAQSRVIFAARIVGALDERALTAGEQCMSRAAGPRRLRKVELRRYAVDRLVSILGHLDRRPAPAAPQYAGSWTRSVRPADTGSAGMVLR